MVSFGHTASGAAIGLISYQVIGQVNPAAGFAVAGSISFIAHYLEDFIPHGHFFPIKDFKKKILYVIIFDLILSITVFLAKAYIDSGLNPRFWHIFIGIFFSQLPDVFEGLIHMGLIKNRGILGIENQLHELTHWHGKGAKSLLLGTRDLWQLVIILVSFFLV